MISKTIYLIRHGQTDYNLRGVVQGSGIDAHINETGISQAADFHKAYQNIPFQKIYTSKLQRTVQSVQEFINSGIPFEQLEGLNEISWGHKEGKIPNSNDDLFYKDLIQKWSEGQTHLQVEGGESPEDVALRQRIALSHIIRNTQEELILIAMHGRAMRILLAQIMEMPLSQMDNFDHSNLCLYKLSYSYQTEKFVLELENCTNHLNRELV